MGLWISELAIQFLVNQRTGRGKRDSIRKLKAYIRLSRIDAAHRIYDDKYKQEANSTPCNTHFPAPLGPRRTTLAR